VYNPYCRKGKRILKIELDYCVNWKFGLELQYFNRKTGNCSISDSLRDGCQGNCEASYAVVED
jgi:type VI protein secretion system component Hcp